jgi:hypothetical protein
MALIFQPGGASGTCRSDHPRGILMKLFKLIGLAWSASLVLSTAALAQELTIAVAGPMTGGESAFGRQMKNGAEQAVADFNAAGGVLGRKLTLDIEDDACDPKQARSVAEKIAGAKIPFVAGHYCSSSSIPASEAYEDGNVLQITPASTATKFTDGKLWNVARVCGRDDQQGPVAAAYIAKTFAGKNVAILNDKTSYGKGLADETKKALNAAGFTEKMFESYNKGDKDFNAIVSRLKRGGRRAERQGICLHRRPGRGRHAVHLRSRPAQQPRRERHRRGVQGQEYRPRRLHALHLRRDAGVVAGRRQGRLDRRQEGDGQDQGQRLGNRDRQPVIRRQGRHQAGFLCGLEMGRQGQRRRDQSEGIVRLHSQLRQEAPRFAAAFSCGESGHAP